jgi:hypothetical protein
VACTFRGLLGFFLDIALGKEMEPRGLGGRAVAAAEERVAGSSQADTASSPGGEERPAASEDTETTSRIEIKHFFAGISSVSIGD